MLESRAVLGLALFCATWASGAFGQKIPFSEAADAAVRESKLTLPGSPAFHLRAKIAEKGSPDSDFKADVEIFWVTPEKWRRTIQSPDFSQTLIVNGDKILEQHTSDYFPFWLRQLVTAMVDPLPMIETLKRTNTEILKPSGSKESTSCARFQSRVGIPPVENTVFSVYCFEGSHGLIESAVTPGYAVEFKEYKNFKDKRVARLLVTDPEPGTTIEAKITELSEFGTEDESLFAISQPTPREQRLESVVVPEASLRDSHLQAPDIKWPVIRAGRATGVLSLYISADKSGQVRETFALNSDNPNMSAAAREQVMKWQFKPAIADGEPVQVESILTFAYSTTLENPVTILSDAEARKLASNRIEPDIPRGAAPAGTFFTVRASLDVDGKLLGVENPNKVPHALFSPAFIVLTQWHFRPFIKDGKPDIYKADITFRVR
jgi:hypothetical protein